MKRLVLAVLVMVAGVDGVGYGHERTPLRGSRLTDERVPNNMSPSIMAFSPDGKTLITTRHNLLDVWNVADGTSKGVLNGHEAHEGAYLAAALTFSPNGEWLASGTFDGQILLWKMGGEIAGIRPTELCPNTPQRFNGGSELNTRSLIWCKFSHDGTKLAWISYPISDVTLSRELEIHLSEFPSLQEIGTIRWKHEQSRDYPGPIAFSADDRALLFIHRAIHRRQHNYELKLWDAAALHEIKSAPKSASLGSFQQSDSAHYASFVARDSRIVIASTRGQLKLIEVATGRSTILSGLPGATWNQEYEFSSDGRHIAVGQTDTAYVAPARDAPVVVCELATRSIVATLPHESAYQAFPGAFSDDGTYLATVVRYTRDTAPDPKETRPTHFLWKLDNPVSPGSTGSRGD